jgi:hypothetical protein
MGRAAAKEPYESCHIGDRESSWREWKALFFTLRSLLQGFRRFGSIEVFGPPEFRARVLRALSKLNRCAPEAIGHLQKNAHTIVYSMSPLLGPKTPPGLILLPKSSMEEPLHLIASRLAHHAHHSKLYWEHHEEYPGKKVPPRVFASRFAENLCLDYQCEVLVRLRASPKWINRVKQARRVEIWRVRWG